MKVLIVTYYWPPAGGAGVQRWLKFAKYLPQYGITPIIYTVQNPTAPTYDQSLLKDISPELEVIRENVWEPYDLYRRFTGKKRKKPLLTDSYSERGKKKNLRKNYLAG